MADSNVWALIDAAAAKYGEDPAVARGIATIESGGNPLATNGSMKGVFQFSPATWARYGHGADPYDAAANIDAGVRLLHDNRLNLQSNLERAPSPGELYLAHQQGAGGAAQLIANPNAPASQFVGNAAITGNGGYAGMTAGDFAGLWARKMNGVMARAGAAPVPQADLSGAYTAGLPQASGPDTGLGDGKDPNTMSVPSPEAHDYSEVDAPSGIQLTPDAQQPQGNFGQGILDAIKLHTTLNPLSIPDFDPYGKPHEMSEDELKKRMEGLDPKYASWFANAVTPGMADKIEAMARQNQESSQNLSALGWRGSALDMLASTLSPDNIMIGMATGGLGKIAEAALPAVSESLLGRVGINAATAATANTAAAAGENAIAPPGEPQQSLAHAALTAALWGGAFGVLSRAPEGPALVDAGRKGLDQLSGFAGQGSAGDAGAAVAGGHQFGGGLDDLTSLKPEDAAKTAYGNARWSVAAELGRSPSAAARAVAGALIEDGVGKQDNALNPHSAELETRSMFRAASTELAQFRQPAFKAWRADNGLGWWEARGRAAEFEKLVHDYIYEQDPTAQGNYPIYVKQYGDAILRQNDERLMLMQNPLMPEGLDGKPIAGFANNKGIDRYIKQVWSGQKVISFVTKNGLPALQQLVRRGLKSALPDMEDDVLDRLSTGFADNINGRLMGVMDEKNAGMFAAHDLDAHEKAMVEMGVDPHDAAILRQNLEKAVGPAKDSNAKMRQVMDMNQTYNGVRLKDLLVNDATYLQLRYLRDTAGKIALARQRIVNPATGKLLVNGLANAEDWTRAKRQVSQDLANSGAGSTKVRATLDALDFARDRVLGIPANGAGTTAAKVLSLINKFNIVRLGSSFVFPHSGQLGRAFSQVGVRSMLDNLPGLKKIITADGRWVRENELDRDTEAMWGAGQEPLMQQLEADRWDHLLGNAPYQGDDGWLHNALDRANHGLTTAGHAVAYMSGMTAMDSIMRRWTVNAIVGKFAHLARTVRQDEATGRFDLSGQGTMSSFSYKRLQHLGLDPDMMQRVLQQSKDKMSYVPGMFGTTKVNRLNLEKWTDGEARSAFINAVQRFASKTIQDNDIGAMSKWMGSPFARTLMQLRNFPLAAWDKAFLHNLHMHDGNAAAYALADMFSGLTLWGVQKGLQSVGSNDPNYWEHQLTPEKIMSAAIQRSSWGSIIPIIGGTALKPFGVTAFDERSTGQPSDAVSGNPIYSGINDMSAAVGAIANPVIHGRAMSQDEVHAIQRLFSNHFALTAALNLMTKNLPAHAPWAETHPHH